MHARVQWSGRCADACRSMATRSAWRFVPVFAKTLLSWLRAVFGLMPRTAAAAGTEPADPGARTRAGRYASAAQARQLADALGADAIEIEVGCCGAEAVEQAVGISWGLQAARDLPSQTPVLVRGNDLRLAAAAANRLADGGLTHVWLVTP